MKQHAVNAISIIMGMGQFEIVGSGPQAIAVISLPR